MTEKGTTVATKKKTDDIPETTDLPEVTKVEAPAETSSTYEFQPGDDIAEVLGAGFDSVSSTHPATREQRVVAHNSGYRLVSKKDAVGWDAVPMN